MPISIPYTFTQTATAVTLDLELPLSASTTASPDLVVTPLFLKLSAPPALLTLDLSHAIVPHTASWKRHAQHTGRARFTLECSKETAGEWAELEWKGSRDEREARRRQSLQWWDDNEERTRNEKSEHRRRERKEDRERGWEWQRQQKEQIVAAKGRERVVALDELKSWQQQQTGSAGEVWEAKTGETIEVIEEDDEGQQRRKQDTAREEKAEERKYASEDDKPWDTPPQRPTPATATIRPSAPPPPIRSTTRLTTTFTAVHPSQPSLPARESNPVKATLTAPTTDIASNLLQLKDKADAYYKRKDLHSAITAYTQLLDDKEVQLGSGGGEGEWRYGWVVSRVLSNRSACYLALATRTGIAPLAQQPLNVQRAEEDATEALDVLSNVKGAEANEEEKKALEGKLRKRLVTLYGMQGKWDAALLQVQAAELKEEEAAVSQKAEAVRRGEDVRAQHEAEQLLSHTPALLSAALRRLDTALSLSPLSLASLQLRLDVYGRLGEWDKAVRDAVLGVALWDRLQQSQQRLWWIGRRGECYIQLKQFSAAQADLHLLTSTSTPYGPLTATSLLALMSSLSYRQRHHALLSSLPTLRSSSSYAQLKSALSSLLSLQSSGSSEVGGDEWMLGLVEAVSEQGWCELKLREYDACVASCTRSQATWSQWSSRPQPSKDQVSERRDSVENEHVEEERLRVQLVESERQTEFALRVHRWHVLTGVRKATALCYTGRLSEGRDEYERVLQAMDARQQETGSEESEEERTGRAEVAADVAKIDAAIAATAQCAQQQ